MQYNKLIKNKNRQEFTRFLFIMNTNIFSVLKYILVFFIIIMNSENIIKFETDKNILQCFFIKLIKNTSLSFISILFFEIIKNNMIINFI